MQVQSLRSLAKDHCPSFTSTFQFKTQGMRQSRATQPMYVAFSTAVTISLREWHTASRLWTQWIQNTSGKHNNKLRSRNQKMFCGATQLLQRLLLINYTLPHDNKGLKGTQGGSSCDELAVLSTMPSPECVTYKIPVSLQTTSSTDAIRMCFVSSSLSVIYGSLHPWLTTISC